MAMVNGHASMHDKTPKFFLKRCKIFCYISQISWQQVWITSLNWLTLKISVYYEKWDFLSKNIFVFKNPYFLYQGNEDWSVGTSPNWPIEKTNFYGRSGAGSTIKTDTLVKMWYLSSILSQL